MKALIFDTTVQYIDQYPMPERREGEARIRVLMAGICQTDIEISKGYMNFKGIMGHEFVGRVEDCDDETWIGKRIVGEINCACGICASCRNGLRRHCPDRTVLGIYDRDGAFAEYVILPVENLHEVPDTINDDEAVFTEPLAAAYRILEQAPIALSDRVIVLGDGRLGLLISQVLRGAQGDCLLLGKHRSKLDIVQEMGIRTALVGQYTGEKADMVVECTGTPEGFETALQLLRPEGTLILKSTYAESQNLDLAPIVINEITVIGSRCGAFEPALVALNEKSVMVKPLISKIMPLDHGKEALVCAASGEVVKVLLRISENDQ